MAQDDDAQRVQLEGRAELLEATRLRYRALVAMLGALRWRARLRKDARLVREVARVQPEVDAALEVVAHKAAAAGWSASSEVLRCEREVRALRERIDALVARRLGDDVVDAPLGERLAHLEERLLTAPRVVLPGQRWAAALEVLPDELPDLPTAQRTAFVLEGCFSRPLVAGAKLPFTRAELDAAERAWDEGTAALEALWRRVGAVDRLGTLRRYLEGRARRLPLHRPRNGPETLLFAEFWRGVTAARLDELVATRLSPLSCREGERFLLARWLLAREVDPDARLAAVGLSDGRAGLFELALELSVLPVDRARTSAAWRRVLGRAQRADQAKGDESWAALQDQLRLLLRIVAGPVPGRALPPLERAAGRRAPSPPPTPEPDTLAGLVQALRDRTEEGR